MNFTLDVFAPLIGACRKVWPAAVVFGLVLTIHSCLPDAGANLGLTDAVRIPLALGVAVLLWLAGGYLANRLLDVFIWRGLIARTLGRNPPRLAVQITAILVYLLAISGILRFVFEQSVTALWAASGAVGLVVGLALRNLIMDTFSGLAIHLERPFLVGHWINCHSRMGNYIGRVEETNWRTTRLWTTEKNLIIIPNSFITNTVITNFSMPAGMARFELDFVLDFSVPTGRALRILSAALVNTIGNRGPLANPAPKVRVNGTTEYGVQYRLRYTLDPEAVSPSKARNTIVSAVLEHLDQAGISPSYPRKDVFLARMPWRHKSWTYQKDQVRQLGRISLFSKLDAADLEFIAGEMSVHSYEDGTVIVNQGEAGGSMYILAEGLLEVLIDQPDGSQLKVADLAPGTFFAEKSMLTGDQRSATIICVSDSVVCEITKSCIVKLLERNPLLAETLSRAVVERDMHNELALNKATREQVESRVTSVVGAFLGKMKNFFGI